MIKGEHTLRSLISDYHYCNMSLIQKESFYILSCYIGNMSKKYYELHKDYIYPYLIKQDYAKLRKNMRCIKKDIGKAILEKINIFDYHKNLSLF